jgi:hypothetical protein
MDPLRPWPPRPLAGQGQSFPRPSLRQRPLRFKCRCVNLESKDSRFRSKERTRPQATATLPGSTAAQVHCTPAPALRRILTNSATSPDYLPPRCTPKGQPGRRIEPYEQEGDQHLPLRNSRTSPETLGANRQPKLSVQPVEDRLPARRAVVCKTLRPSGHVHRSRDWTSQPRVWTQYGIV